MAEETNDPDLARTLFREIGYSGPAWDALWEDFVLLGLDPGNIGLALDLSAEQVAAGRAAAKMRLDAMVPVKRQQRRSAALLRRPGHLGSNWGHRKRA